MFHKEGFKIIIITTLLIGTGFILIENFVDSNWLNRLLGITLLIVYVAILQFFRNPKRNCPQNENHIISPVDGKVVVIEEVYEKEYFKDQRIQVSIFMSPLNVHVTRYPCSGIIRNSKYHPGKYLVAWHPKSSEENERTTIVVATKKFGDIVYRQIAGALAKRIVNYAEPGMEVRQGDDAGFIKFGSRVDIFLPLGTIIDVSLNQKVTGGIDTIAHLS
jgi:phosphatidylserine decarboxylase